MSIVRYTNKKTGVVTLYESTSHYDPVTKQSRPIRKYLGKLDPETGELIPSTKRKKKETTTAQASPADLGLQAALEEKTRECKDMERPRSYVQDLHCFQIHPGDLVRIHRRKRNLNQTPAAVPARSEKIA